MFNVNFVKVLFAFILLMFHNIYLIPKNGERIILQHVRTQFQAKNKFNPNEFNSNKFNPNKFNPDKLIVIDLIVIKM